MASGGASRNQEWCGRDGYQLVGNSVEHHCLALHPPLLENIFFLFLKKKIKKSRYNYKYFDIPSSTLIIIFLP